MRRGRSLISIHRRFRLLRKDCAGQSIISFRMTFSFARSSRWRIRLMPSRRLFRSDTNISSGTAWIGIRFSMICAGIAGRRWTFRRCRRRRHSLSASTTSPVFRGRIMRGIRPYARLPTCRVSFRGPMIVYRRRRGGVFVEYGADHRGDAGGGGAWAIYAGRYTENDRGQRSPGRGLDGPAGWIVSAMDQGPF